ncbi:MAG TPA: hypothetical protein VGC66_09175 [Pyrinomonadaceae bacterium]|jgi:hypothetical protein
MIRTTPRLDFTLVQLGKLNRAEVINIAQLAERIQRAFGFKMHPERLPLNTSKYKLPNKSINLEAAAADLLQNSQLPRPIILLTSAPFGDQDYGRVPDYYFFSLIGTKANNHVSIISTYRWEHLPGIRRLQPYLFFEFARFALDWCADMAFHDETRGCFFDYCDDPTDFDYAFQSGPLCNSCEQYLNALLRSGVISIEQIASVRKLFNRAIGKKVCFVVMPFKRELKSIYEMISAALSDKHWTVIRADELAHPRRITDTITQAILMSDLVVADITGSNPNVFYELGVAHTVGCDVILLSQDQAIPFDITTERTIFYKNHPAGRKELINKLKWLAGSGEA